MAGREPEERVACVLSRQRWQLMTFLHWPYDPEVVRPLLAPGLEVDTYGGQAWVGLTPFLMVDFRLSFLPPVPVLSTFPETNVRTYVRGPDGTDGLWFLSLEADSLPTVIAASTVYGVPYRWADMTVEDGTTVEYRSRRRTGGAGHRIAVRPGAARPDEDLSEFDHWLTGRWRAYSTRGDRLVSAPVRHEPWPLRQAQLEHLEESLLAAAGLPEPAGEPILHYSPGVDVALGPPRAV